MSDTFVFGDFIAEGKTKIIQEDGDNPDAVIITSKDDLTAGDGAKHDVLPGKGALANQTTCNVFRLLQDSGLPVAFDRQINEISFLAPRCQMLPFEVVVRRAAYGSYLKRAPHLEKGHIFPRLVCELFLKTSGRKWREHPLVCDDPHLVHGIDQRLVYLHDPKEPNLAQTRAKPFLVLPEEQVFSCGAEEVVNLIEQMDRIARHTFLVLEKAWQLEKRKIVDFKVEFGFTSDGRLLLADVIDSDSWRVIEQDGGHMDKQVYREGGDLDVVMAKYRLAAELTGRFGLPIQSLVFWRGSEKDDLKPLWESTRKFFPHTPFKVETITCSVHKEPVLAYRLLQQHLSAFPDSVLVALIGRSNGAGPTLSANTMVPVITVPASYRDFPDDVWSSLRAPSNVPVMTVLEPGNATLAALQILAMRNPAIYAVLRLEQEKRLSDL